MVPEILYVLWGLGSGGCNCGRVYFECNECQVTVWWGMCLCSLDSGAVRLGLRWISISRIWEWGLRRVDIGWESGGVVC
ncbi:hypothetical protein DFH27DRAFT_546624 [Peziza echinospora]|nr:hypothetical protein DFH27DRAFT_546624 [Peziza echinospora]